MKTYLSLSLSLIAMLNLQEGCADLDKQTVSENYCTINEAVSDSWLDCDDKLVRIKGSLTPPQEIMQHPMLDMPLLPSPNMDENSVPKRILQTYMNVGNRQIILLSDTNIDCIGDLEVIGMLEKVSLGGPAGTKSSYEGWSVRVDEYQCF